MSGGSAFCQNCGQMSALAAGAVGTIPVAKSKTLLTIAAIAAAIAGVILGLTAAGLLRFGSFVPRGEIRAPAEPSGTAIAKADKPSDAPIRAPAQGPNMPAAVRAWLEHLERMEIKKNKLHEAQANELKALASSMSAGGLTPEGVDTILDPGSGMPDPRNIVDEMIQGIGPPWEALRREFLTTGPPMPAECAPIAKRFEDGLTQVVSKVEQIRDLMNAFNPSSGTATADAGKSQGELGAVKKDHKTVVDNAFKAADGLVGQICAKYNTPKWFEIDEGALGGGGFMRGF
ncbi:MAG: hypothetical protein WAO58_11335 [Fimbriimonadaceae bacterium]